MGIISELDEQIELVKKRRQDTVVFLQKLGRIEDAQMLENLGKISGRTFKTQAKTLKELRVAVIMDEFTLESYRPECQLLEVTPDNWKNEIMEFQPELLFIESAWKGKNDLWYRKVDRSSKEIYELTTYCHEKKIPVIFWNKEDPIYTSQFMTTAALADFVFTTDIDCVQRYKTELGHEQVYHLHFAAQPIIHNPLEKYERKDKFCFAGAYYHRYPHRAEVFDKFSEVFIHTKGLDIYDRNYLNARPEHAFPERYNPHILGSLPASKIDVAYKGYIYGINMNSVQQSQTMFARRAFEMLASNTVTVGNYSRGMKNYFGDLTICTDDYQTMEKNLDKYCFNELTVGKYRLAGLRKVLSEHLYEDRMDFIVQKVFGVSLKRVLPKIAVVARCQNKEEAMRIREAFNRQEYVNKVLYLIGNEKEDSDCGKDYLTSDEAKKMLCGQVEEIDYYACISHEDYYGKNYLLDIALATRYYRCDVIGKGSYYTNKTGKICKEEKGQPYTLFHNMSAKRVIVSKELVRDMSIWECADANRTYERVGMLAVDPYNYCEIFTQASCNVVDDIVISDTGISLDKIEEIAEKIQPVDMEEDGAVVISAKELYENLRSSSRINFEMVGTDLKVNAKLEPENHDYSYCRKQYRLSNIVKDNKFCILIRTEGTLDCIYVCISYNEKGEKINTQFFKPNVVMEIEVPEQTEFIRIGFRLKGTGSLIVHNIILGRNIKIVERKGCFLSRSGVLVLSNQYPAPESLYRNMFVHMRVLCYKNAGKLCDVMRMNRQVEEGYREFEGINIIDGSTQKLSEIMDSGQINTVCVHFLDEMMWNVLKDYIDKIKIYVWLHGAEIQPWWRREYNYHNKEELEKAKKESEKRMDFWQSIFTQVDKLSNLHFIFVSQYFAEEIFEDNKIRLPKEKYTIIHNCIDTSLFLYESKTPEQRKKILSIRPYASEKYANDLTVKCILELAKKTYFDELEFRIIGNGVLFESTLKPLRKYRNVIMEKRFLRQDEIAELHKKYGIFLTPTRMDAQGVSRDEAMASGLVPVTNAVAAIPEFTDEDCAILASGEDHVAMAEGINSLYWDEQKFLKMSENAAKRVRNQSSPRYTIDKEVELIYG